jgi:hypothetical protein
VGVGGVAGVAFGQLEVGDVVGARPVDAGVAVGLADQESESFWGRRAPGCLVGVHLNKTSWSYTVSAAVGVSGGRVRLGYQR